MTPASPRHHVELVAVAGIGAPRVAMNDARCDVVSTARFREFVFFVERVALDLHRRAQRGAVLRPRRRHLVREPGRATARSPGAARPRRTCARPRWRKTPRPGTRTLKHAPCAPRTCHLAILSLHASVAPGNASRAEPQSDAPRRGRGIVGHINGAEPLRIARRDDAQRPCTRRRRGAVDVCPGNASAYATSSRSYSRGSTSAFPLRAGAHE